MLRRTSLLLLALVIVATIFAAQTLYPTIATFCHIGSHQRFNVIMHYTPSMLQPLIAPYVGMPKGETPSIHIVEVLKQSTWPGEWPIPALTPAEWVNGELVSPALLMLHIFSMPTTKARLRRDLIRHHSTLETIPEAYRHLIEVKFVLGKPPPGHAIYDEKEALEIDREEKLYGDLVRLEGLRGGENMNEGKSLEWLRWVGRRKRVGLWVLKCDDDTFPILPNLLPFLLKQDPANPSYVGTGLGRSTKYHHYFEGMMYGFSWGVVKTLAMTDIPEDYQYRQWHEDASIGELLFSLPLSPSAPKSCFQSPRTSQLAQYKGAFTHSPKSPDPCTGLRRLDLWDKLRNWHREFFRRADQGAVGWHWLKDDAQYIDAYETAKRELEKIGRWKWDVPSGWKSSLQR
nr:hypothetical protein L203_03370 [Cryptococcus depauperatus CBS 7841]